MFSPAKLTSSAKAAPSHVLLGLGLTIWVLAFYLLRTASYNYGGVTSGLRWSFWLVPLWLLAWDPPLAGRGRFEWVGMMVVALWIVTSIARFATFARETESFRAVMAQMEPGRRVASMVVDNASPLFATPVYLHFPAWY